MTVMHYKGIGHPWTAEPGWDQLYLGADTMESLQSKITQAEEKFWRVWFLSEYTLRVHMYKPTGATRAWHDVPWQGTPRGHGHQFRIGDKVYTDFASSLSRKRITHHEVTEIQERIVSQTGIMLRVHPPVPGSSFRADDPGRQGGAKTYDNAWIDSAWFRKAI